MCLCNFRTPGNTVFYLMMQPNDDLRLIHGGCVRLRDILRDDLRTFFPFTVDAFLSRVFPCHVT